MALKLVGEPTIAQDGANVLLEAVVETATQPDLKWTKDDKDITTGTAYKMSCTKMDGGKFKICCEILNFDKSQAGVYKCGISNASGSTSSTFTVTAGDAPEFTDKPHIVQRDGGNILGIKVRAKSKTPATAEWTKNDQPITPSDRVKPVVKTDDAKPGEYLFTLEISMPEKSDEAKYRCIVKNKEGSNSQSLNLNFD